MKILIFSYFNPIFEYEEELLSYILNNFNLTDLIIVGSVSDKNIKEIISNYLISKGFKGNFKIISVNQVNQFNNLKNQSDVIFINSLFNKKYNISEILDNSEKIKYFSYVKSKKDNDFLYFDLENVHFDEKDGLYIFNCSIFTLNYLFNKKLFIFKSISELLDSERYLHSQSVANLAYNIAIKNNLEFPKMYYVAGILHDIAKDLPISKQEEIMEKHFKKYTKLSKIIYHQFVAKYILKNDFNIKNSEIINGIIYHTTGNKKMTNIAKVIYSSDKIEPLRNYDSQFMIDACLKEFNEGFILVLKESIKYYEEKNINYHNKLTDSCIKYYLRSKNND